ncbi:hypothetical protein DFO70_1112 [Cytobacillus firmus]|uniref:Thoeris anti-defense 2-like domain-containing protein n=2 Tax=Cytobacillus TaxID=2675230 RepID=A0A366JNF3_CYTFI|nr:MULTISPECIES: MW1434 family type I TA system toxin [Cytobacillus]RBP89355.1 hypothetical protein DFO70_1112 [Cytobacillus firmus]TDX47418.1 hypothetical protein DFO72_101515 [Cytobacillus oceanisediminis]
MNIQEAAKKAKEQGKHIQRDTDGGWECIKIKPTDSSDRCILVVIDGPKVSKTKPNAQRRGWQPSASDIVANDWIVVD